MISWPPPLLAVSAYGPPGTSTVAGPPPVLTDTEAGGSAKVSRAGPPSVSTATARPAGTITVKLTLQAAADERGTEHTGSARSRWPWSTDCVTGGGLPL